MSRKVAAALALALLAAPASAQTYPSPTFANVTILGSTYFTTCTGYVYSNAAAAATCSTSIPAGALPATVALLNTANTWSATQAFAAANWSGHIWGSGAAPAVSACGTTPSISTGANDIHGTVTTGTATPTSCTITWASARTNTPDCSIDSPTGTTISSFTPSTTTLVINFSATSGAKFTYICLGQ